MLSTIETLNRRIGDSLGYPNGSDPRFKWVQAREMFYFYRNEAHEDWQRRCWADRIGNVWVLAQWTPPQVTIQGIKCELTREQWFSMFGWSRPYPEKGEYKVQAETALRSGLAPDGRITAFYISTIRLQMEQAERAQREELMGRKDAVTEACEAEAQANLDGHEKEFMDRVGDWEPLSWKLGEPRDAGDQDGPVGFQTGYGDSPVSSRVGA